MSLRIGLTNFLPKLLSEEGYPIAKEFILLIKMGLGPGNSIFKNATNPSIQMILDDYVDFIGNLPMVNDIPANITTGPASGTIRCYLISGSMIETENKIEKFQSLFKNIEFGAGAMIFLITLSLLVLLKLFAGKNSRDSLWTYLSVFYNGYMQQAPKAMSFKYLLGCLLIWIVLIKILCSGFIQMGFSSSQKGRSVETFQDVMELNSSLLIWRDKCGVALRDLGKYYPKTGHMLKTIPIAEIKEFYPPGWKDMVLFSPKWASYTLELERCLSKPPKFPPRWISKRPLYEEMSIAFFSRWLEKKKRAYLERFCYSRTENGMGKVYLRYVEKMVEGRFKAEHDPGCMEKEKPKIYPPFTKIRFNFLADCFWWFYLLMFFSILVFIFELLSALLLNE